MDVLRSVFYIAMLLMGWCHHTGASGRFELKVLRLKNAREELYNGNCCDGTRVQGQCRDKCDVFMRLCMKEFQADASPLRVISAVRQYTDTDCPLGNAVSRIWTRTEPLSLFFDFNYPWPRSFTLIIDVMDSDNDTRGQDETIDRIVHSGVLMPEEGWRTLPLSNARGVQVLETNVRLSCSENYYGPNCARYCDARNDSHGRFTCDSVTGEKKCINGWMGQDCNIAVCRAGCQHGSCLEPDKCDCLPGWEGSLCERCVRYPGCQHGSCSSPFQCKCQRGWGGPLCDQDLSMCERHKPCKNGAKCRNTPNGYACECLRNFEGLNCTEPKQSCDCENGGMCLPGTFECRCLPGFSGPTCAENVDECAPNPCENGGRCTDRINGFRCECPAGWVGPRCNVELSRCQTSQCRERGKCTRSAHGGHECECTGSECTNSTIICRGQCKNGGTCMETISGIACSCTAAFSGTFCDEPVDDCSSHSCNNRGRCVSSSDGPQCECDSGYEGEFCQLDVDQCDPNPCQNGATCYDMGDEYYCACRNGFEGKHCAERSRGCVGRSCSSVDMCMIAVPNAINATRESRQASDAAELSLVPTNVCGLHGTCFNRDDGTFFCSCAKGFRGVYCQENVNDCEHSRCQNGGTCLDGVASYQCICPIGYEGKHCERINDQCCQARNNSCSSKPCRNGGTCVNVGTTHTCICRDGFSGSDCSINIDECETSPCFNGAQCQDGVNYRNCTCAKGYTGHDCRININECEQNPCAYGSECVDTAGSFMCKCPPNRKGDRCEIAIGRAKPPACFSASGRRVEHGGWFEDSCKNCTCEHGELICESVPCVPQNCLLDGAFCPDGFECLIQETDFCFTAPCNRHGLCKSRAEKLEIQSLGHNEACLPNHRDASGNPNCVKILLAFDRTKLPRGVSVKLLCDGVKKVTVQQLAQPHFARFISVACAVHASQLNVIEVAMSTIGPGVNKVARSILGYGTQAQSDNHEQTTSTPSLAYEIAMKVALEVGQRRTNNSLLAAVIDIRVDTSPASSAASSGWNASLVITMCAVVIALGMMAILALIVHHRRAVAKLSYGGYSDLQNNPRLTKSHDSGMQPQVNRHLSVESKSNRNLPPVPQQRQNTHASGKKSGTGYYSKRETCLLQSV